MASSLSRARLLQTAFAFLESYNSWDVPSILSVRSLDCLHHTLPATLLVPPRTNSEYASFLEPMLPVFRAVRFEAIHDKQTLVDVEARKVVMHCRSTAVTDVGQYENEYVFILTMSEDGTLLDEIVEFIDSACTQNFRARILSNTAEAKVASSGGSS